MSKEDSGSEDQGRPKPPSVQPYGEMRGQWMGGPLIRFLAALEKNLPESLDQIELAYSREESHDGRKWSISFKTKSLVFVLAVCGAVAAWFLR